VVPVERRPIVLGRIRFPNSGGMTLELVGRRPIARQHDETALVARVRRKAEEGPRSLLS
jgi:hypothetical protein